MKKICLVTLGNIKDIATMKRALGMANPLQFAGFEVHIVALECKENFERISLECNSEINIHYYNKSNLLNEINQKTKIVNSILPDYVLLCAFVPRNFLFKFKLTSKPVMLLEHSELQSKIATYSLVKKCKEYFIEMYSLFYADGMLCASRYLFNYYNKLKSVKTINNIPILYSPYAFNDQTINLKGIIKDSWKEKYKNKNILIYLGSLNSNYGLFTMIKAIEEISKEDENILLLLIGEGDNEIEAREYVVNNTLEKHIQFIGYVAEEELRNYFKLAKAFISPLNDTIQDWARCPSKIYMYLPFNKPILTCRIGEPFEIFGTNGYYFETNNYKSLSELVRKVFNSDHQIYQVDILKHTWNTRTKEFVEWLNSNFSSAEIAH